MYGPARTLHTPDSARMAMDHSMEDAGGYALIQHAFEMGQGYSLGPSFMGYAALSSLMQNGLIRACIETVADDMTREWIEISAVDTNGDGDSSDEKKTLDDALIDFCVRQVFHKAAEFDGYFGGCLIYIDTGADDRDLLTPLDISEMSAELKNLKRFTVIEPINVFPGLYQSTNPLQSDYFEPRTWWVLGKEVHASRIIRICGNEVPVLLKANYNFLGVPQAQVLYDYVIHFQDARVAESRLLDKFSQTVLMTDMQDILTNPNSTKSLDSRLAYMSAYRSNDGILAIDKEMEEYVNINTPLSGVTDIVRQQLEMIVAINRTPAVKLLGISPAGFNTGDADLKNYNDHISTQQEKVFRKGLQKVLDILQIVKLGKLNRSVTFDFVSLNESDDKAAAEAQSIRAQTHATYLENGVLDAMEVRKLLANDPASGFAGIDADAVPEMQNEEAETENSQGDVSERGSGNGISPEVDIANQGNEQLG